MYIVLHFLVILNVIYSMEEIVINGLLVEIENEGDNHWRNKKILIHDVIDSGLEGKEVAAIVAYLYDEGFIEDRRIEFEVIKPLE